MTPNTWVMLLAILAVSLRIRGLFLRLFHLKPIPLRCPKTGGRWKPRQGWRWPWWWGQTSGEWKHPLKAHSSGAPNCPSSPSSRMSQAERAFVSPSGAQGLTLKAGEQLPTPTAPTRQSPRNFISSPTSVKSRKRKKTVLISPKGKILFDITDKALKIAFDKRGPR